MLAHDKFTLKQLRGLNGLTQKELADKIGVSERTIANYEKDVEQLANASYSRIKLLAITLDVTVDNIFLG